MIQLKFQNFKFIIVKFLKLQKKINYIIFENTIFLKILIMSIIRIIIF